MCLSGFQPCCWGSYIRCLPHPQPWISCSSNPCSSPHLLGRTFLTATVPCTISSHVCPHRVWVQPCHFYSQTLTGTLFLPSLVYIILPVGSNHLSASYSSNSLQVPHASAAQTRSCPRYSTCPFSSLHVPSAFFLLPFLPGFGLRKEALLPLFTALFIVRF